MNRDEIQMILKRHSKVDLERIVVELYRLLSDQKKEEEDLKLLITHPEAYLNRDSKRIEPAIDLVQLLNEAREFIHNAREGNYFTSNHIINKKERSQWHVTARRIYQGLLEVSQNPLYRNEGVQVFEDLYYIFCRATEVYLFASEDPFLAIQVSLEDFLAQVLQMSKRVKKESDWMKNALDLTAYSMGVKTSSPKIYQVFFEHLKAPMDKKTAFKMGRKILSLQKASRDVNRHLIILLFYLGISLGHLEESIQFFKVEYGRLEGMEQAFITLLEILEGENLKEEWMKEYQLGVGQGFKRRSLEDLYHHLVKRGYFPGK